jgi:hypothetical protein
LSPEPVLSVSAILSGVKPEKSGRQSIFEECISSNLNDFETNIKHESVIPVLLTKKYLQNVKFMEYLIDFFDSSRYIKSAIPSYITEVEKIYFSKEMCALNIFS